MSISSSEPDARPDARPDEDDHRRFAERLDLVHFQDEAPGMAFWHPRGHVLYRLLEEAVREVTSAQGYAEVKTPQILRRPVWEASGHWQHFLQGMFRVDDQTKEAAVKPVSCPGHVYVVQRRPPSYRELPLRLCELGVVHRDEPSGTLAGLLRLRQFTQDDGHIFCAEDQAEAELARFCESVPHFYRAFGFDQLSVALSTRPAERAGEDAEWDRAEAALTAVLQRLGTPYVVQPGAGAFYGPKIEYALHDRRGRSWQCGTIQFDFQMPRSFQLHYVDASGARRHPVMLHRALYGSLERFLGILLEHHGAALPAWLAPVQVTVLPIAPDQLPQARLLAERLQRLEIRAQVDAEDSLAKRIARAHERGVPFQAILGAREAAAGEVTLRGRDGQRSMSIADATAALSSACTPPPFVTPEAEAA